MNEPVLSPISSKPAKFITRIENDIIISNYLNDFSIDVSKYFGSTDYISLYECLETGYRFYYPFQITGDAKFYAELQKNSGYYPKWKWENEKALKYIKSTDSVLDVGCGEGNFLKKLLEKGINNIQGLDFSSELLTFDKASTIPISNESVDEYCEKNKGKFDVVVCFQVLEHVAEVKRFFESCMACVKTGGYLIIAVPNSDPYLYKHDIYHTLNLPPHHAGLWNMKALNALGLYMNTNILTIETELIEAYLSDYTKVQISYLKGKFGFYKWLFKFKLGVKLYSKFLFMFRNRISGRNLFAVFQKKNDT